MRPDVSVVGAVARQNQPLKSPAPLIGTHPNGCTRQSALNVSGFWQRSASDSVPQLGERDDSPAQSPRLCGLERKDREWRVRKERELGMFGAMIVCAAAAAE